MRAALQKQRGDALEHSITDADRLLPFPAWVINNSYSRIKLSPTWERVRFSRHSFVTHEPHTCRGIRKHRAVYIRVVPIHIEDADVLLHLIRQKVRIPAQTKVRRDVRTDPVIVLYVCRRDVQPFRSDLTIVLCEL